MSRDDGINTSPKLRQGMVLDFHLQSRHTIGGRVTVRVIRVRVGVRVRVRVRDTGRVRVRVRIGGRVSFRVS